MCRTQEWQKLSLHSLYHSINVYYASHYACQLEFASLQSVWYRSAKANADYSNLRGGKQYFLTATVGRGVGAGRNNQTSAVSMAAASIKSKGETVGGIVSCWKTIMCQPCFNNGITTHVLVQVGIRIPTLTNRNSNWNI